MNSSEIFFAILFITAPIILIWIFGIIPRFKTRRISGSVFKKIEETIWDHTTKVREMNEIQKQNFRTLETINFFLNDVDYEFLKEIFVPEFNSNSPSDEHFPLDLSEKKLRKAILEKAEQYYAISDPLLEILAESFVADMRRQIGKHIC